MTEHLQPVDFDRDTGAFFEAAQRQELIYRHCNSCDRGVHPPTQYCKHCGSHNTGWRQAEGTGKLFSWTTVTHEVHPAYPAPYTVVVVALTEAPDVRLIGAIPGAPALQADQLMEVHFARNGRGPLLPQWRGKETRTTSN